MKPLTENRTSDKQLEKIKNTVLEFLPGSEVILFGSRARGDYQVSSDYDILVIADHPIDNPTRLHFQSGIRKRLAELEIIADVILQSRSDMEIKKNLPGHIVRSAMLEGTKV